MSENTSWGSVNRGFLTEIGHFRAVHRADLTGIGGWETDRAPGCDRKRLSDRDKKGLGLLLDGGGDGVRDPLVTEVERENQRAEYFG